MMMNLLLFIMFWYVCGVFNVAVIQATERPDDRSFDRYHRTPTLWLCYGAGGALAFIILLWLVIKIPVKSGTRFGRYVGRIIQDIHEG
jgi:4-hydroxybenzoate polyprenyltransferase